MRKLYLVRHGEAVMDDPNPNRPLSERGTEDIKRIAIFLARAGIEVARIIHSDRVRAEQTAKHIVDVLGPAPSVELAGSGLAPNDSTDLIAEAIAQWSENVMLVGHMPFMGRLTSRLVIGAENHPIVDFDTGTVACLAQSNPDVPWVIDWVMKPAMFRG